MTKFTIELPDVVTVAMRNGASVEIETAKLSPVITELLDYGIGQKVRDGASGAAKAAEAEGSAGVQAEAQAMIEAVVAKLYAGEWSARGSGGTTDPRVAVARSIVRKAIKEKLGSKSPEWKRFTGLSDADQLAKLDETYSANAELFDPAIDAELKRRADANKAKAKVANAMAFNI
jgi:hypothetical protein